jgi:hypothetical protein
MARLEWRVRASSPGLGCHSASPPVRAGRAGDGRAAIRWRKLRPTRLRRTPPSPPPGCDGPTTGSRFPGWSGWRSGSRPPAASATHAPHDVEPAPRVPNPPRAALVARPRWRSLHRNTPTSDVPCPRRAPAHRLRIDGPLPLRTPLGARLGSPSDQDRRSAFPVRRARAHDPGRLRRIDTRMLATRVEPKPPSPPAAAFEGNDACACRPSSEGRSRMTARPAAPHRSHSHSLRGPRHLAECLGFLRARSRDPPVVLRLEACVRPRCVSTDLCHPNQTTASTHASCAPGFFSEACASRLPEGLGPSASHELALEGEPRTAWGRSTQQGRGTRVSRRGYRFGGPGFRARGALSAPARAARSSL